MSIGPVGASKVWVNTNVNDCLGELWLYLYRHRYIMLKNRLIMLFHNSQFFTALCSIISDYAQKSFHYAYDVYPSQGQFDNIISKQQCKFTTQHMLVCRVQVVKFNACYTGASRMPLCSPLSSSAAYH